MIFNQKVGDRMEVFEGMSDKELTKISVEEFSRLQGYMKFT